ncbi:hypothetical protein DICVIV_05378 [Dictyocaulus viviparus]|uniref:Uncharacterized protein n=1 Tax=Dictyocaulus viviparus TaxID=29172 RepID=A0A0D8XV68_DICVI|nr:hypothetical protein DICVIV_05378 [Dictyocaulus viviparus]
MTYHVEFILDDDVIPFHRFGIREWYLRNISLCWPALQVNLVSTFTGVGSTEGPRKYDQTRVRSFVTMEDGKFVKSRKMTGDNNTAFKPGTTTYRTVSHLSKLLR